MKSPPMSVPARNSEKEEDQGVLARLLKEYVYVPEDGSLRDYIPDDGYRGEEFPITQQLFDKHGPVPLKKDVIYTDTPVTELDKETHAALEGTYGVLPKGSVLRTLQYESGNTFEIVVDSEGFALPAKVGGQASKPRANAPKTNGK